MKPATRARVDLTFIKLRAQFLRGFPRTRITTRQQRRRRFSFTIDAHETVPKRRDRARFDLHPGGNGSRQQLVNSANDFINQHIRIELDNISRLTPRHPQGVPDLVPELIEQRGPYTRRAYVNAKDRTVQAVAHLCRMRRLNATESAKLVTTRPRLSHYTNTRDFSRRTFPIAAESG